MTVVPRTLPGRLLLLATVLVAVLVGLHRVWALPPALELVRRGLVASWLAGVGVFVVGRLWARRRRVLWRVRRKLALSYVFLGVVPVVLVLCFVLAGGALVYVTVASYTFHHGVSDTLELVAQNAETLAVEMGRDPSTAQAAAERRYSNLAGTYPRLSLAVVPSAAVGDPGRRFPLVAAGPWAHGAPPAGVPDWLGETGRFSGVLAVGGGGRDVPTGLLIRAVDTTPDGTRTIIVDLPVDAGVIARLAQRTGTTIDRISLTGCGVEDTSVPAVGLDDIRALFRQTVAFLDCTRWTDGARGTVSVGLVAPVGDIYTRVASASATSAEATTAGSWDVFLQVLILLGLLFLVVQGSALVMGALLARSITSAVHELFVGTQRVQRGDFTHRIAMGSRDQLGELATSFNRMSESIEHLLLVQREKQRLDDELRIARDIQRSLLPIEPPRLPGLDVADLCEPAREVGGDYYDFFDLGPRRLGVLIADVSGKGTSAALYMAELKGLVLALSQTAPSPRQLLMDVNRRLSVHLRDNSFVTMTYATIDLDQGVLTLARAGHTPTLVVSGGESRMLVPDGMVLGLGWPGAMARFDEVLEEQTCPIGPGDIVVLYTDGISEAMNPEGDLFGDAALARVVAGRHDLTAAGIRERVLREVRAFAGEADPHDDMTMVVLRLDEADG